MKHPLISMGQVLTLLTLALFALGAELIPVLSSAGAALWLLPLLALPITLLGVFLGKGKTAPQKRLDLADALLMKCKSKAIGKGLCILFLLWGLWLLTVNSARAARRLGAADASPLLFAILLLGLALWMLKGSLPAMARSAEIFFRILAVAVVAILILAFPRIQPSFIFLVDAREMTQIPGGLLALFGILSVGTYAFFFWGDVSVRKNDVAVCYRKISLFFASLTLLLSFILGSFGAPLVAKLQRPFFQMIAALGVEGAFQRLEALYSALWMLGDLALLTILLFAMGHILETLRNGKDSYYIIVGSTVLALVGGVLLAGKEGLLRFCQITVLPWGGLVVGLLILGLFLWSRNVAGKGVDPTEENS